VKDYRLLLDLHRTAARQGPGGEAETRRALELAMVDRSCLLKVADIGCGTGASTLVLAQELNGTITAVDIFPEFLEILQSKVRLHGLTDKIALLACSMEALPFADGEFDVIWSEGAVYNMGFEKGIARWKGFLKPGGMMIISEITWLSSTRPLDLQAYWEKEYPEIDTASSKIGILERHGYTPEAYFVLPKHCWLENYYLPMQNRFADFLQRNGPSEQAMAIVDTEKTEIAMYEKYNAYYSYGFYVARKLEA
jgi:cyclopropane fatty-acyl-phospholipid synthase-like methyltransferase